MKKLIMALALATPMALPATGFAEGDAAAGEKVFRKCQACHMVGENAKNRVGPTLNGIFGRAAGSLEGYRYSKAMTNSGLTWDDATLTEYLANPRKAVKGTKMAFAGLRKEAELANVIAYLKQFNEDGSKM